MRPPSLYETVLGARYAELAPAVQTFHCLTPEEYIPILTGLDDYSAEAIRDRFMACIDGGEFTDDATVVSILVAKERGR